MGYHEQTFVGNTTVITSAYGNVYETVVINKYGSTIKSRMALTDNDAIYNHRLFIHLVKGGEVNGTTYSK